MKIDDTQKFRSFRFPTVGILALVSILALCFRLPQPLHAAQFKATAVHMINGRQTGVEQIYVSGDWVRIETPMGKGAKVTLLRPDRQVMVEMDTRDRSYKEMPGVPGASWANFYRALQKALTQTGEEAVAGQTCQRLEAPGGVASFWFSKELDFPIRTVMSGETIELHNIVVEEIDPKIFEPPAGYQLAFSIFAMQNGQPKFKPEDIAGVATPSLSADASSGKNSSLSKSNPPSILPEPEEPLPDPLLRIRTVPSNGGRLPDPEEPLAVLFSRPVLADHFSFTLSPDPGGWQAVWNGDATKVLLHHEKPFASGQTYTLTASMIGEADISASFTVHALDGALRLDRDLARGAISIDQVARVRLNQIFNPSAVSDQYRRQNPGPSGTWNMLQIARSLDDLTPETKREITPYFLPPTNPGSVYYNLFHSSGSRKSGQSAFNFVAKAWADDDTVKAVYKTGTGYEVIVWGDRRMKNVVYKARDLIKQYKMYERFERLMNRKTLDYGDHSLNIYIMPRLREEEGQEDGQPTSFEPGGLCYSDKYLNPQVSPAKGAAATILISAQQCPTDRELGSTLAHEMFHAFQYAFTVCGQKWLWESTAVWAENFIDPAWNTEQAYLDDAFNDQLSVIKALTDTSSDINAYAMYLFPLYMTKISPGYDDIIRRIWETNQCGVDSVQAVKSALGDFDAHWKTYALATLDEMPEDGQFPDMDNTYGDGPLLLSHRHLHAEFEIDEQGYGGAGFGLTHLGAAYIKAKNDHKGPDAPAISFDLRPFHGNNQITVQAIIKYRDGHREYEDWSDMPQRIFCLSHEDQNFEEVIIVVACAEDKERKEEDIAQAIDVAPALDNDCYRGSLTMTWRLQGQKNMQRKMGSHSEDDETLSATWARSATVRLDLKPWREDMPPQLSQALGQLESNYPDVKKELIEKGRRTAKAAVRAPVVRDDPNTGCKVHRYRVTACHITAASGRLQSKKATVENDAMGLVKRSDSDYSENASSTGLDDNTQEWLDKRDLRVDVHIDPESDKIKWVEVPSVGVKMEVYRNAKNPCTKRYQDNKTGTYHYKDEDNSWSDSIDSSILLTFESDSDKRTGQPMDPVWKAQNSNTQSASGRGRKERPLDHKWNEFSDKGEITGKEIEEFTWRLNLAPVKKNQ